MSYLGTGERPGWHSVASCRGMGTAMFFPNAGDDISAARQVCERCPVRAPCNEQGLLEVFGVWAGLSGNDRKRVRLRHRPACGTLAGFNLHRRLGEHCGPCTRIHNEVELSKGRAS